MKRILVFAFLFAFILSGCGFPYGGSGDRISDINPSIPTVPETSSPEAEAESLPEPTEITIEYKTYYVVNCEENISLYASADMNSAIVCKIPFGASVSYIQSVENGFAKIAYQGTTGYALAACLSSVPQEQETYTTYYVVNCHEYITLRESPSTGAAALCKIPLGASVSFVSTAENGFYKVSYMGVTGYALASYLSQDPNAHSAPPEETPDYGIYTICYVVNCKQSISLRSYPSTSADAYCQIPLGTAITYLETSSNGFYKVIYDGMTGYVLASYISFTSPDTDEYDYDYLEPAYPGETLNAINSLLIGVHFRPGEYGTHVSTWSDSTVAHIMYSKLLWDGSSYMAETGLTPEYSEDYYWHFDLDLVNELTLDTLGRDFPANTGQSFIFISGNELLLMPSAGETTVLSVSDITEDGDLVYAVGTATYYGGPYSELLGYFEAVLEENPASIYGYTLISLREITND